MPWPVAMWGLLIWLGLSSIGCATKREPSPTTGRNCILAFVETENVNEAIALFKGADIRVRDAVVTKECLEEESRNTLLEIFHLTK